MMIPAKKTDWQNQQFTGAVASLAYYRIFTNEEMKLVRLGLLPVEMEDKWFIYYENDQLHFHRSWTGNKMFELNFVADQNGFRVIKTLANRNFSEYTQTDDDYDVQMLDYLINRLLLDREAIFPASINKPAGEQAIYQFSMVGNSRSNKETGKEQTGAGPGRRKKLLAICGSTRRSSSNKDLIHAIMHLYNEDLDISIYEGLENIPAFNPDQDGESPPPQVGAFRQQLKASDAVLICTPEYAMGVPGALKNAIDWTVSSMEFSHKPVALITASSLGEKGHASLLETLNVIEAYIPENFRLLIPYIKTKVKGRDIIEPKTAEQVKNLMGSLIDLLQEKS